MIKFIFICAFLGIIFSLGTALRHLVKYDNESSSRKTAKALTVRIGLSVLLFILLIILVMSGVIQPHGIGSKIHPLPNQETAAPVK